MGEFIFLRLIILIYMLFYNNYYMKACRIKYYFNELPQFFCANHFYAASLCCDHSY